MHAAGLPYLRSTEIESLQSLREVLRSRAASGGVACVEVVLNVGDEPINGDRKSPHVWFDEFRDELGPTDKRLHSKIIRFATSRCMFESFVLRLPTEAMFLHLSSARLAVALQGLTFDEAERRLRGLCAAPLDNTLARECPLLRGVIVGEPGPSQVVELRLTPAEFVSHIDQARLHELGPVLVCTEASHYWFVQPHPASPRVPSFSSLLALHRRLDVRFLELFRVPDASDSNASDSDDAPVVTAAPEHFTPAVQLQIAKAWTTARDTLVVLNALPQPDPLTGSLGVGPTKQQLELILLEMRDKALFAAALFKDEFTDYDSDNDSSDYDLAEKKKPEEFKEYEKIRNERASIEGLLRPMSPELKARVRARRNQAYFLFVMLMHVVDGTPDFVLRLEERERVIDRELRKDEAANNKRRRLDE